ncbi:MAG: 2-oxo-4-hydroxy-4-carboxy-5-ureidoimidazoline decarboxylase [Ornithinimicrobium sp.]
MAAPQGLDLSSFNALDEGAAREALYACCSSHRWAKAVAEARPFRSQTALFESADAALAELGEADVDDAMSGHPRIGDKVTGPGGAWSRAEQGGMSETDADLEAAMAQGNRDYEERFGHVYLICATGMSASELLSALHQRLGNDPLVERAVIREEFRKINRLRLAKLIGSPAE